MKESENVSLFITSFYEKKFLKLYFSYFRGKINSTQGFMKNYPSLSYFSYWLFVK